MLTGATIGSIRPFAQQEMVVRFIEGIDVQYRKFIDDQIRLLLSNEYPSHVAAMLSGKINQDTLKSLLTELTEIAGKLKEDFTARLDQFQQDEFVDSILDSVATLPKADLAAMAEALVNLTAFKRKVTSNQPETVSLPIDVAVISKGEGFIWIKKKHYFDAALNPNFFRNYYRRDER